MNESLCSSNTVLSTGTFYFIGDTGPPGRITIYSETESRKVRHFLYVETIALLLRWKSTKIPTKREMVQVGIFVIAAYWGLLASSCSAFAPVAFVSRATTGSHSTPCLPMAAVDTSEIKNGLTIEIDGEPYRIMGFSIMKQARGAAKTTIKMKNLIRGTTLENTYRSGEKFETALVEKKPAQFTYVDETSGNYFFMDMSSFEELMVEKKQLDDKKDWLGEGMEVSLVTFKGQVIDVDFPKTMVFTIVDCEPTVKGNTAQGFTKPAKLDCGATINVPGFLDIGAKVKVDMEKRDYMERA